MGCRTLNSAGFLSLRDDSPPEEEDEQQFGQVAVVCFFFVVDWLADVSLWLFIVVLSVPFDYLVSI